MDDFKFTDENEDTQNENLHTESERVEYTPPMVKPVTVFEEKRENTKSGFSLLTILISVLLSAVIGMTSGFAGIWVYNKFIAEPKNNTNQGGAGQQSNSGLTDNTDNTDVNINVENLDLTIGEAIAKKVTPSVVGIRTTVSVQGYFGTQQSSGEGSGVIYTKDGYIITNYHVIGDAVEYGKSSEILVFLSGDTENGHTATVVGYNISNDLAVIKINGKNLPAIELADSDDLLVGQYCMAIGNPGGLQFMGSATWGIVSGLNRILSDAGGAGTQLIQTDAAINPGNSGGALVNVEGKLIGINSSKLVSESVEGMGFAIPSNTAKEICDKIISKEADPDPYIGVTISQYDAATLQQYGYPVGAWIYSVVNESPAAEAGIRRGDIITEFNGVEIKDYTMLFDAIADCSPGQKVKVKLFRASAEKNYTLTLTVGANNSY